MDIGSLVAACVLLQEVYRITRLAQPPPAATPSAAIQPDATRREGGRAGGRDKLTDDWYLMKIRLPAGSQDESALNRRINWPRDVISKKTSESAGIGPVLRAGIRRDTATITHRTRTCAQQRSRSGDIKRAFYMQYKPS
jgi:hypothetical protein